MSRGTPNQPERLALRPAEAAKALGVCLRTLRNWMRDEGLPYLRVDGVVLIPRDGLGEWMTSRVENEHRADELADDMLNDLSK